MTVNIGGNATPRTLAWGTTVGTKSWARSNSAPPRPPARLLSKTASISAAVTAPFRSTTIPT